MGLIFTSPKSRVTCSTDSRWGPTGVFCSWTGACPLGKRHPFSFSPETNWAVILRLWAMAVPPEMWSVTVSPKQPYPEQTSQELWAMVVRIVVPLRCAGPNPWNPRVCYLLVMPKDHCTCDQPEILRRTEWGPCDHDHHRETGNRESQEGDRTTEAEGSDVRLALKMEGASSQDMQTTCRCWKRQGKTSPCELPGRMQSYPHSDFCPVKSIPDSYVPNFEIGSLCCLSHQTCGHWSYQH